MTAGVWALVVLAAFIVLALVLAFIRGLGAEATELKIRGLGLPRGSVRAMLALAIIGGFLVFAFFGDEFVSTEGGEDSPFVTILTAFATLTASVTGYYFGARTGQNLEEEDQGAKPG